MKKVETLITANIDNHSNFEEYFKIIGVIKENESTNPDICIESCKALIEGVSKTIYNKIDSSKSIAELDKYTSVEKLFKDAMSKLAEKCDDDFEGDFVRQYSSMIHVIGEIRNKRGDISHGRVAPKPVYSSIKFASTVVKMTESILEYILEHYFQLDLNPIIKLDYDAEEMVAYNAWLDENVAFPIAKARYSKVLYENDYDEYEIGYTDFLKSIESDESAEANNEEPQTVEINILPSAKPFDGEPKQINQNSEDKFISKDIVEKLSTKFKISQSKKTTPKIITDTDTPLKEKNQSNNEQNIKSTLTPEESKKLYEAHFKRFEVTKKDPVILVNTYIKEDYWTESRMEKLNAFQSEEQVNLSKLELIIDSYIFSGKRPLRDDVVECLNEKPALKDRAKIVDELIEKIIEFVANDLK
jgi:hypothetical protein